MNTILSMNTTDNPKVVIGVSVLLLVVGVGLTAFGVMAYQDQTETLDIADEVDATIVTSEVLFYEDEFDQSTTDDWESDFDDRAPDETEWQIHVEFEYEYEGEQYTSDNIDIAGSTERFDEREDAEEARDEYPAGERVTAHVDPDEPDEAFLEAEMPLSTYLLLGFGVFLIVGSVFVVGMSLYTSRKT